MSFGKELRAIREMRGMNQEELAERSGLSRPFINQIETGARGANRPDTLRKLSRGLSLPIVRLYVLAGHFTDQDIQNYKEVTN